MHIRIGTRDSLLALWQAEKVQSILLQLGHTTEIVKIKSDGDKDLVKPLYEMNIQGIFTKSLDTALLNNVIDIAVHSYKDIPTLLAKKLIITAVMQRDTVLDVLLYKTPPNTWQNEVLIATSSLRRRAQWLYKFPKHTFTNIRGNIHTRIQKLEASNWQGMILSSAGLERMKIPPKNTILLDWMLPAPAQGCIAIIGRENDDHIKKACQSLHNTPTHICTHTERSFLKALMGGCALPISALATIQNDKIIFKGNITTPDGKESFDIQLQKSLHEYHQIGEIAAYEILKKQPNLIQKIQLFKNG